MLKKLPHIYKITDYIAYSLSFSLFALPMSSTLKHSVKKEEGERIPVKSDSLSQP